MRAVLLITLIISAAYTLPALANELSNESIQAKIKSLFQNFIAQNTHRFVAHDDIAIQSDGKTYQGTLPTLQYKLNDGHMLHLGRLPAHIEKSKNPQQWTIALTPSEQTFIADAARTDTTNISFKDTTLTGIWHESLNSFQEFDFIAKAVTGTTPQARQAFEYIDISVNNMFKPSEHELWDGHGNLSIGTFEHGITGAQNFESSWKISGFSPEAKDTFNTRMATLKIPQDKAVAAESLIFMESFSLQAKAEKLNHILPFLGTPVSVENLNISLSSQGLRDKLMNSRLTISAHNIQDISDNKTLASILPENITIQATQKNAPLKDIAGTLASYGTPAFALSYLALPKILADNQTRLTFTDTVFSRPEYTINLKGDITVEQGAIFFVTAKIDFDINQSGLDYLLQQTERLSTHESILEIAGIKTLHTALQKMDIFGIPKTTPEGPVKSFTFEIPQYGGFFLNGLSLFDLAKDRPACSTCDGNIPNLPSQSGGAACGSCGG